MENTMYTVISEAPETVTISQKEYDQLLFIANKAKELHEENKHFKEVIVMVTEAAEDLPAIAQEIAGVDIMALMKPGAKMPNEFKVMAYATNIVRFLFSESKRQALMDKYGPKFQKMMDMGKENKIIQEQLNKEKPWLKQA